MCDSNFEKAAGNVINISLISDLCFHPSAVNQNDKFLCPEQQAVTCSVTLSSCSPPRQGKISAFIHMRSNGVADGTEDWGMAWQKFQRPKISVLRAGALDF